MNPKIVVASDSMKGSLTSAQVAASIANGIHSVIPSADVLEVPIADGGEGTTEAIIGAMNGQLVEVNVQGPLGYSVLAHYGIAADTAIIEMAQAAGLELVPPHFRNPMNTSTFGVGEMIVDALNRGCRHIIMCIGGSATNDGGLGMLRALGARIYDIYGNELPGSGSSLPQVAKINLDNFDKRLSLCSVDVACDVDNPLHGPNGAARVFARQKGADDTMIEVLDVGLQNYGELLRTITGRDIASLPGAGAAGGLGAALVAILHANLKRGIDVVLDTIHFDTIIQGAQLIITGEGHIDLQTLSGKAPLGVLQHGLKAHIPVIAVAGQTDHQQQLLEAGFTAIYTISDPSLSLADNMRSDIAMSHLSATSTMISHDFFRPLHQPG